MCITGGWLEKTYILIVFLCLSIFLTVAMRSVDMILVVLSSNALHLIVQALAAMMIGKLGF